MDIQGEYADTQNVYFKPVLSNDNLHKEVHKYTDVLNSKPKVVSR